MTDPLRDVLSAALHEAHISCYAITDADAIIAALAQQGVTLTREPGLRAAAREMADAYRDIEGDVISGRTDKPYAALRAALASEDRP